MDGLLGAIGSTIGYHVPRNNALAAPQPRRAPYPRAPDG